MPEICIAQDAAADRVLTDHPFALLAGTMLDQRNAEGLALGVHHT
jgi:hypothetical protein